MSVVGDQGLPRTYAVDPDSGPRQLMAKLHAEGFDKTFASSIRC